MLTRLVRLLFLLGDTFTYVCLILIGFLMGDQPTANVIFAAILVALVTALIQSLYSSVRDMSE